MLVVEDGDASPAVAEHVDDLAEELIAWVQALSLVVRLVFAVLADEHDAVHGEFVVALGERLPNRRVDRHRREAFRAVAAQVVVSHLVDVERHHLHLGAMVPAVPAVALEEAVYDVLGVGIFVVDRHDGGDAWASRHVGVSPHTARNTGSGPRSGLPGQRSQIARHFGAPVLVAYWQRPHAKAGFLYDHYRSM